MKIVKLIPFTADFYEKVTPIQIAVSLWLLRNIEISIKAFNFANKSKLRI